MRIIYNKIKEKKIYFLIFIIILTLISSLNLFHKGIIFNHDINFHLHRIIALKENLDIGKHIPVYFNYLNGFGYGNGLFYPDIFIYIPAILLKTGFSLEISFKLFIILINLFAILGIYICVKRITKKDYCSYLAMILYACSTYRLIDLVERGALGEILSFVFLPLLILGIYEILYGENKKGHYLTIGLSGLCFSHIISFYLACIFLMLIILINYKKLKEKERIKSLLKNIIFSILITINVWAPMFEQFIDNKFNIISTNSIDENIISFPYLFIDIMIPYLTNIWFPPGIGIFYFIIIIIYIKLVKAKKINDKFLLTMFILGIISLLMTSFKLIWKIDIIYHIFKVIQFPWRFYMFETIFLVIATSIFIKYYKNEKIIKLIIIYSLIIYISNSILYFNNIYTNKPIDDQIMLGEYLPKDFNQNIIKEYQNNSINVNKQKGKTLIKIIDNKENIEVPLIYYKGYKACDNKKCYKVYKTENNLVGVKIDKNTKQLNVYYNGTKIYNVTKYISICGILLYSIYIYKKVR